MRSLDRSLALLWLGQLVSTFGDALFLVGLPFLVLELTNGSARATGFVQMSTYLPVILFGLAAGVVVDRVARRRVMLWSDALRGLVLLAIPILWMRGGLTVVAVGLVAFCLTGVGSLFNPARDAYLPQLVGSDPVRLGRANALMQTSQHLGFLVGPLLAGAVALALGGGLRGTVHLFTVDAVTFFVSFAVLLALPNRPVPEVVGERETPWAAVRSGLGELRRDRRLGAIVGLTTLNNLFIMGTATVVVPIYVRETLGQGAAAYGLIEGCMAGGMLVTSAALLFSRPRIAPGTLWTVGLALDGLTYLPFAWTHSVAAAAFWMALHGLCIPLIIIPRTGMVQRWTRPEALGRVFAVQDMTVRGVTALSAGAAGLLAARFAPETLFIGAAIGAALCGGLALFVPTLREHD